MNIALWIVQCLLALAFLGSGVLKGTQSKERMLATGQTGVRDYSLPMIRFAAGCELLAVAGLILPWWTGIAPVLTPLAAVGLAILMVFAGRAHAKLSEPRAVTINMALLALAVFVATGRLGDLLST